MVRTNLATSAGLLIALLLTAGLASANPLAIASGEGGGSVAGEVAGAYHADATGAVDAAEKAEGDATEKAKATWTQSNTAYEQTRADAWTQVDEAEMPDQPDDVGEEQIFDQVEQASTVEASHTDKVEKAADLETEYVDAGVDVSAAGSVKAFFKDAVTGIKDAYMGLKDALKLDTSASEDAKAQLEGVIHMDDALRGEVTTLLDQEIRSPDADPRLDGTIGASHASDVTSSALAQGQAGLP